MQAALLRRLNAFAAGHPLPTGETKRFPVSADDDVMILAFVRMGGESAPWGLAYGHPGATPTVLSVPEPRNRTLVADMIAEFAPAVLQHLLHPSYSEPTIAAREQVRPLRQIWLPNDSHQEMLHLLDYAYTRTKFGAEDRAQLLRSLGHACGFAFRESQRPGQVLAMVATARLKESFTFPAEDLRQGHLGFLLAWLATKGNRERREAAAALAELEAISTSLDPAVERDVLSPMVSAFNDARSEGRDSAARKAGKQIESVLHDELLRRFRLVEEAIKAIRADKRRVNLGVADLVKATHAEHWSQFLRVLIQAEDPNEGPAFVPSPETDRYPAAAAARYYLHESSAERALGALLHDDRELQAEALAQGEAINGTIVEVRPERDGKKSRPVWVIETDRDLAIRLREGAELCVASNPGRQVRLLSFGTRPKGGTRFEVQIHAGFKADRGSVPAASLKPEDPDLVGEEVLLLKPASDGFGQLKAKSAWRKDTPGKRFLLRVSTRPGSDLPSEIGEDVDRVHRKAAE